MADSTKIGVMMKAAGNGKLRSLDSPCSLCGSRDHKASIHGREAAAFGPAVKANQATQFDSSRNWREGGTGSCLTTGSMNYCAPAESGEKGMS